MTKYNVYLPAPSAKRKAGQAQIVIEYSPGDKVKEFKISPLDGGFEFEVEDKYQWIYSGLALDGFTFQVYVKYTNFAKNTEEKKFLVPEKVKP